MLIALGAELGKPMVIAGSCFANASWSLKKNLEKRIIALQLNNNLQAYKLIKLVKTFKLYCSSETALGNFSCKALVQQ